MRVLLCFALRYNIKQFVRCSIYNVLPTACAKSYKKLVFWRNSAIQEYTHSRVVYVYVYTTHNDVQRHTSLYKIIHTVVVCKTHYFAVFLVKCCLNMCGGSLMKSLAIITREIFKIETSEGNQTIFDIQNDSSVYKIVDIE